MNYLKTFLPYLFGNKKGKSLEFSLPDRSSWSALSFEEKLTFHALANSINSYVGNLDLYALSTKDRFQLLNFFSMLKPELKHEIESQFKEEIVLYHEAVHAHPLSKVPMQELINFKPKKLSVIVILHKDRTKTGTLLVKNENGDFVTDKKGHVWSIPVLGLSGRRLPFHHSNGCTPMGVYTIDSVMPEANKAHEFGKYRRLIVNFIPGSEGENELKKLLPKTHHQMHWWKQSVLGRELGRSLLRIHGTGRTNNNFFMPYYPFVPTSGCLATNEATILGMKEYHDQRLLLDVLMKAQGLESTYENESKIHGLLYVVEFDDSLAALKF
jgi:hypothetical protein